MERRRWPIVVVEYERGWVKAFDEMSGEVGKALGACLVEVHHVGSTSVEGLAAKPVIDLLAVVKDVRELDQRAEALVALGYEAKGEFGIAGRRYFRRDDAQGVRTHQIHAFQADSPEVGRLLAFRDFLRAHPGVAAEYGRLKQQLAAAYPESMEGYMAGKDGFIQKTLEAALKWAVAGR